MKARFLALILCALASLLAHPLAQAYVLTLEAVPGAVSIGDVFTVRAKADTRAGLLSFDLGLTFDNLYFEAVGSDTTAFDDLGGEDASPIPTSTFDNGAGTASAFGTHLTGYDLTETAPVVLATFDFKLLANPASGISVSYANLGVLDPLDPLSTLDLPLPPSRLVVVRRAPEPGSLALLGLAVAAAGFGGLRRRRAGV